MFKITYKRNIVSLLKIGPDKIYIILVIKNDI